MNPIHPKDHNRLQAWQDAAVSCGLQIMASDAQQPKLEALAGLLWVRIETCGDNGQSTRVAIAAPGPPDFVVVRIRPESFVESEEEIEIGDELFDSTFLIKGPAPMVLALLDAETRRLLLRLKTETRLEISLGEFRAENDSDEKILALLPLLLDAGKRFVQPPDVARRLAENVRQDPETRVRLQSLLFLIREYPEEPETVEALRASGAATVVDALAKLMAQEEGTLAIAAAQTLGETGSPAAEPPLILALQRESADLRMAAIKALGRVGTASAVMPLMEAAERSWLDADLRRATGQAIAEIQSRLQGASPGQLSLAGAETGQLSLAEAEAGQLSFAADQAGQLSISDPSDKPGKG